MVLQTVLRMTQYIMTKHKNVVLNFGFEQQGDIDADINDIQLRWLANDKVEWKKVKHASQHSE